MCDNNMPARVKRIMMKHGTSGVVTIPMSYRKYHDLNPGDEMIVIYDSLILMAPKSLEYVLESKQELIDELLGMIKPTNPKNSEWLDAIDNRIVKLEAILGIKSRGQKNESSIYHS